MNSNRKNSRAISCRFCGQAVFFYKKDEKWQEQLRSKSLEGHYNNRERINKKRKENWQKLTLEEKQVKRKNGRRTQWK